MQEGDIYLFNTLDGGNISIENGEILMDGGLDSATYISLFSRFDWWGNDISKDPEKMTSNLSSIFDRTLTNQTRLDAIELSRQALNWMIDENIAKEINVLATIPAINALLLEIEIVQPNFEIVSIKYEINWENQLINPVH